MASAADQTQLDYANPDELPPIWTQVEIRKYDDETILIIPPVGIWNTLAKLLTEVVILGILVMSLIHELVNGRSGAFVGIAICIAIVFCVTALCFTCWWRCRQLNKPTLIRVSSRDLTVFSPRFIRLSRTWSTGKIDQVAVSFGSPTILGAWVSRLTVGRGWRRLTVVDGRSKRELLWIARVLNRTMNKR